jgi:hypothetical protein
MNSLNTALFLSFILCQTSLAADPLCTPEKAENITPYLEGLGIPDISSDGIPRGYCLEEWLKQGIDAFRDCAEREIIKAKDTLAPRPKQDLLCVPDSKCVASAARDTTHMCLNPATGEFITSGGSDGNWVVGNWKLGNFAMPSGLTGNFFSGTTGYVEEDGGGDDSGTSDSDSTGSSGGGQDTSSNASTVVARVTSVVIALVVALL